MASGVLHKMKTQHTQPISYVLEMNGEEFDMNALLGKQLSIKYLQEIYCVACGKRTKKSFGQGFCYPCFLTSPMNAECIIRPELCQAHLGQGRDPEWEREHHLGPHAVYLAFTDVAKVGVTRLEQIPTRWIDQGASKAVVLAQAPYRQIAGEIEVALKAHFADKTNWRHMLTDKTDNQPDPLEAKQAAYDVFPEEYEDLFSHDNKVFSFVYPVLQYPATVNSLSLDKQPVIDGKLLGIRGQYLMFDKARVLNLRNHSGYLVELNG
ncbi:MAG: DUF2797 domain-containing protein [Bacteroidetes bacterium]|jgi:hypothetical protein|nr:DUF2797 domain-containing protein [Bacteroidota bacterium]